MTEYRDSDGSYRNVTPDSPLPVREYSAVAAAPEGNQAAHGAVAAIVTNTWTTIVTVTPTVDTLVDVIQGDLATILGARYQLRLQVGGTTVLLETLHTDQASFMRVNLFVAANTAVNLQARHAEVGPQDIEATIFYRAA